MKKTLSILLVISLAVMLFAGCNNNTPTPDDVDPTPTNTQTPAPGPTPNPYTEVIKFNLYDEADYMSRWTNSSKEWMYENYRLVIDNSLPAVADDGLAVESSRKAYNTAIALLFSAEATRPDYMPSLKTASTGADACFKELYKYLADLNPYIQEGQVLHNYITWVWKDGEEYWENVKQAFEMDGKLYALPRREMMPVQEFLVYAEGLLSQINVKWDELPTTWDGFVDLLKAFKNLSDDYIPFVAYEVKLDGLLKFIAATYGLDFSLDFTWTTKNGEPLWTYYWDEYLQILTRANELAADGLVYTDSKQPKCVVHYDMEDKAPGRKPAKQSWSMNTETGKSIASYTTSAEAGRWASSGWVDGLTKWRVSPTMISQDGYEFSLLGTSQIDESWVAVGNRLGDEFVYRICDMISYSLTDEGYIHYCFGREGDPFADSVEEAGNFVWVEDKNGERKMRWLGADDRLGNVNEDPDFYLALDEHYSIFVENGAPSDEEEGDLSSKYGITDTGYFPSGRNFRVGTTMFADITAYPMEMTIYWEKECMSKDAPCIDNLRKSADANNSYIYDGLYRTPTDYLGSKDGAEMETKMSNLKAIAKDFTIGFLGHTRSASDWDSYIKSLQEAGYDDVYEFYSRTAYSFPTSYVDGVMSQSSVNAKRNK